MATLSDIAQATGFSVATISRAIRQDPRLSPETVERVQVEARKLGYHTPTQKRQRARDERSSRERRAYAICLLFPYAIKDYAYTNLDLLVIDQLEQFAQTHGCSLQITRLTDDGLLPATIRREAIDGFIVKSYTALPSREACPELYEKPVVSLFDFAAMPEGCVEIVADSRRCAEEIWRVAVQQLGHRQLIVPRARFSPDHSFAEKIALLHYWASQQQVTLTVVDLASPREDAPLVAAVRDCPAPSAVVSLRLGQEETDIVVRLAQRGLVPGRHFTGIVSVYDPRECRDDRFYRLNMQGVEIVRIAAETLLGLHGRSTRRTMVEPIMLDSAFATPNQGILP